MIAGILMCVASGHCPAVSAYTLLLKGTAQNNFFHQDYFLSLLRCHDQA